MNTIIINAEDFNDDTFEKYNGCTSPFMFDEFKLIIKWQGETWEKFKILKHDEGIMFSSNKGWTIGLRVVENIKEIYPSKGQMRMGVFKNGDIAIGPFIIPASEMTEDHFMKIADFLWTEDGYTYFNDLFKYLCGIMCIIMMMAEERKKITRLSLSSLEPKNNSTKIKKGNANKVFYLNDIVEYISEHYTESKGYHQIKCECWEVRGHYRHYKSGKRVFIPSYKKGKKRDSVESEPKEYIV